jgi:hypothetical protein
MDAEKREGFEFQQVPLVLHESAMARDHRIMRWIVVGWAVTALVLGAIIFCYANSGYEVTTETTTTETTTQSADSGDSGNAIVGDGDITIGNGE